MADKFELSAEIRDQSGKGASRRLRRKADQFPAIIYGAGKAPKPIAIHHHHMLNALKNQAFYSHILTLSIAGTEEKVVLKSLQRHPSKPQILHADFLRISAKEKLTMQVPLHFTNEETAPGVKIDGGSISRLLNDVEIRCLPGDLPEFIEVDLSELKIDEAIHLSQLKLPKGVELTALLHHDDRSVVSIHHIHVAEEPETVEAPPAEVPLVGKEEKAEGEE